MLLITFICLPAFVFLIEFSNVAYFHGVCQPSIVKLYNRERSCVYEPLPLSRGFTDDSAFFCLRKWN